MTRDLSKTFERKPERGLVAKWRALGKPKPAPLTAVDRVSIDVGKGELFGLLGPNGAGKTTLVKLLATLLLPTSGTATVAGLDVEKQPDAVRRAIGVVLGGERALYWRLTARENLWYFSQLYNMPDAEAKPRVQKLLDRVGLAERADDRVETFSKGMKQRLHIARGLLNSPDILLLDEPTIGLDPHAARQLRALVRELTADGTTIVLTTHYMTEAEALSDRVAILNRGRVVALDTPAALKSRHAKDEAYLVTVRGSADGLEGVLGGVPGVTRIVGETADASRGTTTYRLLATKKEGALAGALAGAVASKGATLLGLTLDEPTLEDVFVELTGEGLGSSAEAADE